MLFRSLILIFNFGLINAQCPTGGAQLTNTNMDAIINAGQTVYISGNLALTSITVSGTLYFANAPTNLNVNWIKVLSGGKLYIGERTCPITNSITITLNGPRNDISNDMGNDPADGVALGSKGIGICTGGFLEIWGDYINKIPFAQLKGTTNVNDTTIYVTSNTNWNVGDKIVVTETDYPAVPYTYTEAFDQNEVVGITSITKSVACPTFSGTCDKIVVDTPLKYIHYANQNEYTGYVSHLTRNIKIKGDDSSLVSLFGGHMIIRKATAAAVVGASFSQMGQRGVVGRYPIHFHQLGQTDGISVFAKVTQFSIIFKDVWLFMIQTLFLLNKMLLSILHVVVTFWKMVLKSRMFLTKILVPKF